MVESGLSFDFVLNAARSVAGGDYRLSSRVDELQWFEDWADEEPNSAPAGLVAANWNIVSGYDRESGERRPIPNGDLMRRLGDVFEAMGLELVWSDQVSSCGSCCKAVQTQPDCHGWEPRYVLGAGDIICGACMEGSWQEELDSLAHSQGVLGSRSCDPSEYGYKPAVLLRSGWDGWHAPERTQKQLRDENYFVQIVDRRQFGNTCIVWVPEDFDVPPDLHGEHDPERIGRWV